MNFEEMKSICVAEIQYADNDNITENENIYLQLTFELITHFLRRLKCRRCDTVTRTQSNLYILMHVQQTKE